MNMDEFCSWRCADTDLDMPPMSFSHAELETLPARVEAGLEKDGGLWRIHVVHGRKP